MSDTPRTWFVTGAGRGLGRAVAVAALDAGDRVVATARRPEQLDDLAAAHPDDLRVLALDVRGRDAVLDVVDRAVACFGRLDVVVNNAGYGLVGTIEEVAEADAREIIDTDLLGALWVTQAVLPHLRRQGRGHIVQISTSGAVGSLAAFGLYNAAKWGLEGFSEALASEVAGLGIRVTIAELGGFATDWAGSSLRFATPDPAYDALRRATFGTAEVPWVVPDPAATAPDDAAGAGEPGPEVAAAAQVALALAARRDDYERDARFSWPAPTRA